MTKIFVQKPKVASMIAGNTKLVPLMVKNNYIAPMIKDSHIAPMMAEEGGWVDIEDINTKPKSNYND